MGDFRLGNHRHRRRMLADLSFPGPGPINFMDLHPKIETDLTHGIWWSIDWVFQWCENINNRVYSIPGFLIAKANGSRAR